MLTKLLSRKKLRILGINSGTSTDGVDLALITFSSAAKKTAVSFIKGGMVAYPRRIKKVLERLIEDTAVSLKELGRIDIAYGAYLGKAATRFLRDENLAADLLASHGQTIAHYPAKANTLGQRLGTTIQIGDGNAIAVACDLPVVSDFRRADIALGGEGAPLTPFINQMLFGDSRKSRIIVNIGGIANFSCHPAGGGIDDVRGGDCGPGNVLSDMACRLLFHKPYDRDGKIAAGGEALEDVVDLITEADKKRGISAGREQFDQYLMARLVHKTRRLKAGERDLVASITEATVRSIYRTLARYLKDPGLEGIYITGGGRYNKYMIERLRQICAPIEVRPIEELGYDGDFLEAVSFAVLGGCYMMGRSSTIPNVTGAVGGGVAGKLSLPRQM
jgi:anhydro-N-acetylmuramic acid kinase